MSECVRCPLCEDRLEDARSLTAHLPTCPAEIDGPEGWA
jgi:hypothetical protein